MSGKKTRRRQKVQPRAGEGMPSPWVGRGPYESHQIPELIKLLSARNPGAAMGARLELTARVLDPATREEITQALVSALSGENPNIRLNAANTLINAEAQGAGFSDDVLKPLMKIFSDPNDGVATSASSSLVRLWAQGVLHDFASAAARFLTEEDQRVYGGAAQALFYFVSYLTDREDPEPLMHHITNPLSHQDPLVRASIARICRDTLDFMNTRIEATNGELKTGQMPVPQSPGEALPHIKNIHKILGFFSKLKPHMEKAAGDEVSHVKIAATKALAAIECNERLCAALISMLPHAEQA